jgi:hypothetical protein
MHELCNVKLSRGVCDSLVCSCLFWSLCFVVPSHGNRTQGLPRQLLQFCWCCPQDDRRQCHQHTCHVVDWQCMQGTNSLTNTNIIVPVSFVFIIQRWKYTLCNGNNTNVAQQRVLKVCIIRGLKNMVLLLPSNFWILFQKVKQQVH